MHVEGKKLSVYRIQYYLGFQESTGGLGRVAPTNKGRLPSLHSM